MVLASSILYGASVVCCCIPACLGMRKLQAGDGAPDGSASVEGIGNIATVNNSSKPSGSTNREKPVGVGGCI